eukprot:Tamp_14345.p2 GENE.Tamp_14345~~Tamp_14345.p2  ORF type:complete len:379 (+),score=75.74 Tamp_14345:136-1137(+)
MGSAGFEGYGQEAQAGGEAEAGVGVLPWDGDTVYRTKVLWNGDGEMLRVSERGRIIGWKESNVVAPHTTELADGSVRLRFTVFAPGQMSEWNPGRVGLLESFDIVFSPDRGEYVGAFQRQGEGILTTRGWRHDASPEGQLIAQIVGKWEPAPEDDSQWMAGMTIARDGTFRTKWNSFHNRHEVTDGLVRVESAETRTINLKRTCEDANDHVFEVAQDGNRMTGRCIQSGCTYTLSRVSRAGGAQRQRSIAELTTAMPKVVREESVDSVGCPVCMNAWSDAGVVRVETACKHSFCIKCIVSVCNLTPPVTSGRCALCRATVTLDALKKVERPDA